MVYSTRRFVVCLSVCHFVLMFFSPFSIAIASLGEEGAGIGAFHTFVQLVLVWVCRFPLPLGWGGAGGAGGGGGGAWGAAVCGCGTPWTFLLPFLQITGTGIKSRTSLIAAHFRLLARALPALEGLVDSRKCCSDNSDLILCLSVLSALAILLMIIAMLWFLCSSFSLLYFRGSVAICLLVLWEDCVLLFLAFSGHLHVNSHSQLAPRFNFLHIKI